VLASVLHASKVALCHMLHAHVAANRASQSCQHVSQSCQTPHVSQHSQVVLYVSHVSHGLPEVATERLQA
jgi:hypothetical protein